VGFGVNLLRSVRLKAEAARELLQLLAEDRVEERLGFLLLDPGDIEEALEEEHRLPTVTVSDGDLREFLEWVAEAAEPGKVVALEFEAGGYRVVGDGTLEPLYPALVDGEGRVLETFPHPHGG